jgi:hypothetical protein
VMLIAYGASDVSKIIRGDIKSIISTEDHF